MHVLDSSRREPAVQPLPVESVHVSRGMVLELHQYESRSYVEAPTPSPHTQHRRSDPSTNAGAANQVRQDRLNKLKGFQRIATRYEKGAVHYLGMLTIASILFCCDRADRADPHMEWPTYSFRWDEHVPAGCHAVGWMFTFSRKRFVGS